MSNFTIALLAGLGIGAWIYNQAYKTNGGNTRNAIILGAAAAVGAFILILSIILLTFH